jgi:glycosyltransferase involved in cell wall biosynthesis
MMNKIADQIEILLATYNGGKYLEEQIHSILNQTYQNWNLLIRDDGSKDNTVEIVQKYVNLYPDKIKLIMDGEKNLGPCGNFSRLLSHATANYIMFCDQDDVWKEDKVQISLENMINLENTAGRDTPLLVHTDLEVVDKELHTIASSMFQYQNLNSEFSSLNQLLVQNNVTGCTVMINKKLSEMAQPIPKGVVMHDWWLALVAASFGEIGFINQSTIKYRQHGNNDVGAKGYSMEYFFNRVRGIKNIYMLVIKNLKQAEIFYQTYKDTFDQKTKDLVFQYANILKFNPIKRISKLSLYSFKKQGKIRNAGFWFVISTINTEKGLK